jgi:acyl-coenzyme A thioesterase PaaI-like protein
MFALCDLALYVAILHEIGRVRLAVTAKVSINFLRRPEPSDLIATARLMKLGKRLAVGEVALYSWGKRRSSRMRPEPIRFRRTEILWYYNTTSLELLLFQAISSVGR